MAIPSAFFAGVPPTTPGMTYPMMAKSGIQSTPSTNLMSVPSTAYPADATMRGGAADMLDQNFGKEFPTYGVAKRKARDSEPSTIPLLVALLVIPTLVFAITFWLNSFSLRYSSEGFANIASYCMVLPAVAFLWMLCSSTGAQRFLSLVASACCLAAWVLGFVLGDYNYQSHMRPYYDVSQLNDYPSVNPSTFTGAEVMDAGRIEFVAGSKAVDALSMGFKNGDVYCVAPLAGPGAKGSGNATAGFGNVTNYDFWSVGTNCCHGAFECGLGGLSGLRVMDDSKRNMFEIAIKQAEASHNIRASHPIVLYMMKDASAEIQEDSDDGMQSFIFGIFGCFACLLIVAVVSAAMHPWM